MAARRVGSSHRQRVRDCRDHCRCGRMPGRQGRGRRPGPKPGATAAKDVTDIVLASIDLAKEPAANDHQFRMRRLVIQPGGIVPWHSHDDRPALIYIVSGEITEYASNCAVPIMHKAGDVAPEEWHVALVEEHRQEDGRADLLRPVSRREHGRPAHDVTLDAGIRSASVTPS